VHLSAESSEHREAQLITAYKDLVKLYDRMKLRALAKLKSKNHLFAFIAGDFNSRSYQDKKVRFEVSKDILIDQDALLQGANGLSVEQKLVLCLAFQKQIARTRYDFTENMNLLPVKVKSMLEICQPVYKHFK
jgi:hypothetical protein